MRLPTTMARMRIRLAEVLPEAHERYYVLALLIALLLFPLLLVEGNGPAPARSLGASRPAALPDRVALPLTPAPQSEPVHVAEVEPLPEPTLTITAEAALPPPIIVELPAGFPHAPQSGPTAYTVQAGDTLAEIALRYGVTPALLVESNEIANPQRIHPGFVLQIPPVEALEGSGVGGGSSPGDQIYMLAPGESLADVAAALAFSPADLARYNAFSSGAEFDDPQLLVLPPASARVATAVVEQGVAQPVVTVEPGGVYVVRSGDTLAMIATAHNVSLAELRAANGLPHEIVYPGQKMIIPNVEEDVLLARSPFQWPVTNRYPIQSYWWAHKGIDMLLPIGSPVVAAAGGTVAVAGWHNYGYGYYVIVDHGDGVRTLYAHLSGFAVTVGQLVARGELIAFSGHTGNSTHPHLHFEISANRRLVNPCVYLDGGCG